ncbi:MAG: acyl-CoA ligase (AMP-forming), exosortase A system-associated [Desulfohalobiaceae bacterium]|nr:acyl-CoA ligase (AMP-forming), exosortase A system-associated [Desulfohalobiaceae bacterium]
MRITLADCLRNSAARYPNKPFLVHKGRSLSFAAVCNEVAQLASQLISLGLSKNDRVVVYMEKSPEEAVSIFAIQLAGGVFIDVSAQHKPQQLAYIIQDSGASVLLTTSQKLPQLRDCLRQCSTLQSVVIPGEKSVQEDMPIPVISHAFWEGSSTSTAWPKTTEKDVGAIIYTSGSTGKPKGVVLSHRNLVAGAESVCGYLENTSEDRILSVLPFSFDYGLNQLTTSALCGCTCVLLNYLFPNDILKALGAHSITGLGLIPPLWMQLLQKEWNQAQAPALRYITNTGGALPEAAVRKLRTRLPQTSIFLMYGLTEAFRATYLPPDQVEKRPTSIGKAIPNAEIWVLNQKMEHCRPGEEGELVQRGSHVALGYWNRPEETAKRFRNNPFSLSGQPMPEKVVFSGDRVTKDEEGFLYFVCRPDDMIKTSGYRVSPTEIEEVLYSTGEVKHAAVFGLADDILGSIVVAVISARDGRTPDPKKLLNACRENLANYMVPREIFIWEELPLNANGKIDRSLVRSLLQQEQMPLKA